MRSLLLPAAACLQLATHAQLSSGCFTIGGSGMELMRTVVQTSDGGYAFAGLTFSYVGVGDVQNYYVVKTDANGAVQWNMGLGLGTNAAVMVYDMIQTSDGGFALVGVYDFDSMGLIKLDAAGTVQWTKAYDTTTDGANDLYSVAQTFDGGYVLAGSGGVPGSQASFMAVLKVDAAGELEWSKAYADGFISPEAYDVVVVPGGYAVCGWDQGFGSFGMPVLRLDDAGDVLWAKSYGAGNEFAEAIAATSDGGLVVAGFTSTYGFAVEAVQQYDGFVVKLDQNGGVDWARAFGDSLSDVFRGIVPTSDGGYAMAGSTSSPDFTDPPLRPWVVKCDANGEMLWSQNLTSGLGGRAWDITECSDGGLAITGELVPSFEGQASFMKMEADGTICPACGPLAYGSDSAAVLVPVDLAVTVHDSIATSSDFTLDVIAGGTADVGCLETGITEGHASPNAIMISPNPATDRCVVSMGNTTVIEGLNVTDAQGAMIANIPTNGRAQMEIPTAQFAPGVYTLRATTAAGPLSSRLVIMGR